MSYESLRRAVFLIEEVLACGIQPDRCHRCPIPCRATPPFGMFPPRAIVHVPPVREDRDVTPRVTLLWGDEANGTVLMVVVIPVHEAVDPRRRRCAIREGA